MKITYLGHACFCLEASNGVKVITDPYTRVGYELPSGLRADAVTVSHGHFDHNYVAAVDTPNVISKSGDYTVNGVKISGFDCYHDEKQGALRGKNIIFTFEMDGLKICHFGDLGEKYRTDIAEKVKEADVWLIPVGGTYTIDAIQAKEYVQQCKPKAVIPMHYRPFDGALDIAEISSFLQLFKKEEIRDMGADNLTLNKEDLMESTRILYVQRKK